MKCPECNSEIDSNFKFCPMCSKPIILEQPTTAPPVDEGQFPKPESNIVAIIALFCIGIAIIVIFISSNIHNGSYQTTETKTLDTIKKVEAKSLTPKEQQKLDKENEKKALASIMERFLYPDDGLTCQIFRHSKLERMPGGYKMVIAFKQFENGHLQGVFIHSYTFDYSLKAIEMRLEMGRNLDSIY